MIRQAIRKVTGHPAVDGAGVHLVRVLNNTTVHDFDPFLMLDAFDSTNPADYIKGFPMHPHRGIETFTYLIKGRIEHEDSLGNKGTIQDGESQWMTGGSGILHQEMPRPVDHLLGLQLWINLPAKDKMTDPKYLGITAELIHEYEEQGAKIKVVAGTYKNHRGTRGHHLDATILDIAIEAGQSFEMECNPDNTLFIYILDGSGSFGESPEYTGNKTAVLFGPGDKFTAKAGSEGIRFILATAPPLKEPVQWGGPIVMNTREELHTAFQELENGTFIKHRPY